MFQNVVVVSVIDHKNSPGFEQTVKVGNSSSLILLISTKRAKSPAFLFGIPVTFSFKNSLDKVGKILKGSMDLISSPSPSKKIQIIGGKVCLRRKGKTLLGQQTFCFTPQANFPAHNLDLH